MWDLLGVLLTVLDQCCVQGSGVTLCSATLLV